MKHFYFLIVLCVLACTTVEARWTSEDTGKTNAQQHIADIPKAGVHHYYASHICYGCRIDSSLKIIGDTIMLHYNFDIADDISIKIENRGMFCESINFGLQPPGCSYAIRFADNTKASTKYCTLEHCGDTSLVSAFTDFENVTFGDFATYYYSSVNSLTNSTTNISQCEFIYYQGTATSSTANGNSSIKMYHCNVIGNGGIGSTNNPQINLGTSRADTILITYCNIHGGADNNKVGVISIANLTGNAQTTNIVIDSCEIMYNSHDKNMQGHDINTLIANNSTSGNSLGAKPMETIAEQETLEPKVAPTLSHDHVRVGKGVGTHFIEADLTRRTVSKGNASNDNMELCTRNAALEFASQKPKRAGKIKWEGL